MGIQPSLPPRHFPPFTPSHLHLQPAEPQLTTLEAEGGGSGFLPSRGGPSLKGAGWSQASTAQAGWLLAVAQWFCGRRTETNMEQGKRLAGLILAISLLQGKGGLGGLAAWRETQGHHHGTRILGSVTLSLPQLSSWSSEKTE